MRLLATMFLLLCSCRGCVNRCEMDERTEEHVNCRQSQQVISSCVVQGATGNCVQYMDVTMPIEICDTVCVHQQSTVVK